MNNRLNLAQTPFGMLRITNQLPWYQKFVHVVSTPKQNNLAYACSYELIILINSTVCHNFACQLITINNGLGLLKIVDITHASDDKLFSYSRKPFFLRIIFFLIVISSLNADVTISLLLYKTLIYTYREHHISAIQMPVDNS